MLNGVRWGVVMVIWKVNPREVWIFEFDFFALELVFFFGLSILSIVYICSKKKKISLNEH
jgi:hypothetical protein